MTSVGIDLTGVTSLLLLTPQGEYFAMINVLERTWKKLLGYQDQSHSMTSSTDVQDIIDAVKSVTGATELEILSRRRDKHLIVARYITIQLMLDMTDMSQSEIARVLNRDHTTISYVKKKMAKRGRGATALNTKLAQAKRKLAA